MTKKSFRIVNPPWVYGPSEVREWIDASYPERKERREKETLVKTLENVHVYMDFKGRKEGVDGSFLMKFFRLFGFGMVEENFDSVAVAERILRGFARAGFRNVLEIVVDGKTVYHHPEDRYDVRQTIELFKEYENRGCSRVDLSVMFESNCVVYVAIRKTHWVKNPAVKLFFKGKIEEERMHRFLNYVKKHLDVEVK